jgi:hypothetical protein
MTDVVSSPRRCLWGSRRISRKKSIRRSPIFRESGMKVMNAGRGLVGVAFLQNPGLSP